MVFMFEKGSTEDGITYFGLNCTQCSTILYSYSCVPYITARVRVLVLNGGLAGDVCAAPNLVSLIGAEEVTRAAPLYPTPIWNCPVPHPDRPTRQTTSLGSSALYEYLVPRTIELVYPHHARLRLQSAYAGTALVGPWRINTTKSIPMAGGYFATCWDMCHSR